MRDLRSPQGRWGAGGRLLTNPAVCHPREPPNAVNATRAHVSALQCSAKHGFEENDIQLLARHFLPGEATAGYPGVKEPAFAGMLGHEEMDRAVSWGRGSLGVTNGAHRSPQSCSNHHHSRGHSYTLIATELPQPFKVEAYHPF